MISLPAMAVLLLWGALQAAVSAPAVAAPDTAVSMRIQPTEVRVDLFFSGATVRVEGMVPPGYDAAILCIGEESSVHLKRKGKVLGFLWMNVGDVAFESAPSLYLLSTSSPLADLAPPEVLEELGIGYPALRSRAVGPSAQGESGGDFREFLKLKESESLYSYHEGGVALEPERGGAVPVSAECLLPRKAPWGEYGVRLFGFKGGKGELLAAGQLPVEPVGVTARVSSLARDRGLLYGILAVFIALGVGLLTGLAFSRGPKKGD